MIITYHGKQFFKVQLGDTTLAFNPISKESKLKGARFGADVALISMNHADFNGVDAVTYNSKEPFIISGPGEYEINGIPVRGFLTESQYKKEKKMNTIYIVELEGMRLCFLGGMHTMDLPDKAKESLDNIDVLFIPVGGEEVLAPAEAQKLANKLEASLIIPMDYDSDTLKQFLKEAGEEKTSAIDKLTIKKKDVEGKEGEIIVLKIQ